MKKKLLAILQSLLAIILIAGVFYYLKSHGELANLWKALLSVKHHPVLFLIAILCFGVCLMLCAVRWNILLKNAGFSFPFSRIVCLQLIGHFFNVFIFGATGGDVVKAFYLAVETSERKSAAVTTVFVDRIIGMICLSALATVMMLSRYHFFMSHPKSVVLLFINVVFFVGIVVAILLLLASERIKETVFFQRLLERSTVSRVMESVRQVFYISITSPAIILQTFMLSLLNHVLLVVCIFALTRALQMNMSFFDVLTIFPALNMISALPVTPQGLGVRESSNAIILGIYNVGEAHAVSLGFLTSGVMLIWNFIGGLVYFLWSLKWCYMRNDGKTNQ
jgi:uncharacterized protein (TIRG00374 family)